MSLKPSSARVNLASRQAGSAPRIDDIDLLHTQSIHVPDQRSDVDQIGRVLKNGDQILATKRFDFVGTLARGSLRLGFLFHSGPDTSSRNTAKRDPILTPVSGALTNGAILRDGEAQGPRRHAARASKNPPSRRPKTGKRDLS